jgi:hypothetical protein
VLVWAGALAAVVAGVTMDSDWLAWCFFAVFCLGIAVSDG